MLLSFTLTLLVLLVQKYKYWHGESWDFLFHDSGIYIYLDLGAYYIHIQSTHTSIHMWHPLRAGGAKLGLKTACVFSFMLSVNYRHSCLRNNFTMCVYVCLYCCACKICLCLWLIVDRETDEERDLKWSRICGCLEQHARRSIWPMNCTHTNKHTDTQHTHVCVWP